MALREILTWPDRRLADKSLPVLEVDDGIRQLIDDMFETMYFSEGVGLAAPQVGVTQRVIVVDCGAREEGEHSPLEPKAPIAIINPVVISRIGALTWEEGCLSVPGYTEAVERSARVVVSGLDRDGNPMTVEADELLAVCLQHEIDHLDGLLFVDRLSRLKQEMAKKKLRRQVDDAKAARAL